MEIPMRRRHTLGLLAGAAFAFALGGAATAPPVDAATLLNVSYDPTRELYREFNAAFARHWQETTGESVEISQSHGGSGAQARAVIDGLDADVVTLAMQSDIDAIVRNSGKIDPDWRARLPHNSAPYTSTLIFLVRAGNPKDIRDWDDLVRDDVEVITPNPKTSGVARWNYLAAWAWADREFGGDEKQIRDFVSRLYLNVPVLDTAARGATTTFVQRGIGDVMVGWENEAFLALEELGPEDFEIVVPSISMLAEPVVAVVDANVDRKGTREFATAYLEYLYSPEGQRLAARHFYRPVDMEQAEPEDAARFPEVEMVTIDDPIFGGWDKVQPEHFGDGGVFDQIYQR
jgi:sulfate/thiosulfate transport system substrate-binding protein